MEDQPNQRAPKGQANPQEFLEKHRARSRNYARRANPPVPRQQCLFVNPRTKKQCARTTKKMYCSRHKFLENTIVVESDDPNYKPALVHLTYEPAGAVPTLEQEQRIQQALEKSIIALRDLPPGKVVTMPF